MIINAIWFQFDSSTPAPGAAYASGGGGVFIDGSGPPAGSVIAPNPNYGSQNGIGYGAGGGSGTYTINSGHTAGGNGAPGFVYVEWD